MGLKEFLIEYGMPSWLVGFFARPYLGGDSMEEALELSLEIYRRHGFHATIDLLGEEVLSLEKARLNKGVYLDLIRSIVEFSTRFDFPPPTVSLKPSSLVAVRRVGGELELDRGVLEGHLEEVVSLAKEEGLGVTLEMEDRSWTDLTLELYRKFWRAGYTNLGTVLQSRLHRTQRDVEELPEGSRVRLCIGIYREPAEVALTSKAQMKERILVLGRRLLERGIYTEFATHDGVLIRRIVEEVLLPGGYGEGSFEFQMLLGVPCLGLQRSLVSGEFCSELGGVILRLYVPFAQHRKDAIAYCKRRLMANPSMIRYGLGNALRRYWKGL